MKSTRRGSDSPVHRPEKPPGSKDSATIGLSPRGHLERQAEFHASTQDEALLSCPQSAGTLRSESEIRGTLRFLPDRKSTRLNSSHQKISYAVFCLKKKKKRKEEEY